MLKIKKSAIVLLAISLLMIFSIGGTLAYLTDVHTVVNTFDVIDTNESTNDSNEPSSQQESDKAESSETSTDDTTPDNTVPNESETSVDGDEKADVGE